MLNVKSVVRRSWIMLVGLLLATTAVACTATQTVKTAVEEETIAQGAVPTGETAVRPARNRQLFSRMGQTGDETAVGSAEDAYDDDEWDGVDWFAIAAEAADMDDEAMWEALMSGSSIAELVTANGGDPAALVETLAAAEAEWIGGLADAGEITPEEAAEWTAEIAAEAESFVNDSSWALWEGVDWFTVAAGAIGVDEDTLWEAESIAAIAQANSIEPQTVIDAIAAAEAGWIDELVAADELTAEEAAEWKAELDVEIRAFVEESWDDDLFSDFEGIDWFTVAAETIGVDEDTLWEADSIAAAAEANGVEPQAVVEAIIAAEAGWMDGLIDEDDLTAEEAVEWMAELNAEIHAFVEESWGYGDSDDFEGVDWFSIAAETLNMDEETFWEAMMEGGTIADAAAAQNVDAQAVGDAIIAAEAAFLADLVADGTITQEEADQWTAEINAEVDEFLYDISSASWEGVDWYAIAQEALGMDEDAMWEALDSGQSLTELAAAQGVDAQTIVTAVAAAETEWLNGLVASGEFTQAEMDEWTAEMDDEIDFFMNEKWEY